MRELSISGTALIIVPHSDDEVLLFGGLIQRRLAEKKPVFVALVTNGDYEARSEQEGRTRPAETLAALSLLGLPDENVFLLGYADTEMPRSESFLAGLYDDKDGDHVHPSRVGIHTYGRPAGPPGLPHRQVWRPGPLYPKRADSGFIRCNPGGGSTGHLHHPSSGCPWRPRGTVLLCAGGCEGVAHLCSFCPQPEGRHPSAGKHRGDPMPRRSAGQLADRRGPHPDPLGTGAEASGPGTPHLRAEARCL